MKNKRGLLFTGVILLLAFTVQAQVTLDSSFTTPGFYNTQSQYIVSATAAQPDGKMIVAGNFIRYNNQPSTNLIRLQADGSIDTTFDRTAKTNGDVTGIEVLADGKIILSGAFTTFKNTRINRSVIRLHANGTLDSTFTAPDHIRHGMVSLVLLRAQPDGNLLLYGYGVKAGIYEPEVIRLKLTGEIDTSFHCRAQLAQGEVVTGLTSAPDGKIYVAGTFTSFNGQSKKQVVRLLPNGTVDNSFTVPEFSHYYPNQPPYLTALVPLKDGSLLVGGSFYNCGSFPSRGIVRLKSNGSVDPSFQVSHNYMPQSIAKLDTAGGKVTAGGLFYENGNQFMLLRFNSNGSIDNTFSNAISDKRNNTSYNLTTFATLPDKSINIGGNFGVYYGGKYYTGLAHFSPSGGIDTTLNVLFQQIGAVYKTLVTREGKIMVGGVFNLYGTTPVNNLVRLLPSGALDPTFQTSSGPDAIVTQIAETADSLMVIAGGFKKFGANDANGIARLLRNGNIDTHFSTGTGPDFAEIYSIVPLPDGRLLAGGAFGNFNGYAARGLVRLLANGSIDNTFRTPVQPPWYSVGTMALLKNNQVLVGDNSDRTDHDFTLPLRVWRLQENGTIDSSFTTENQGGFPIARKISVSPAQNIFYAGEVLQPGATQNSFYFTQKLIRLHPNGTNDASNSKFPSSFYVSDFKVLADSAILACGRNLGWNDSANYIMRFKPDLSIDSTFNPIAVYYNLKSLDCTADGRIVVAGEPVRFFNFESEQIQNIAILKTPSLEVKESGAVVNNITGNVDAGTDRTLNSVIKQLRIYNTGSTAAVLGNGSGSIAQLEGADAHSFSITTDKPGTTLNRGDSLLLTIKFSPTRQGEQKAAITIPYNNGIRQRYTFTLHATAANVVTAVPDVQDNQGTLVFPNPNGGSFYIKSSLRQYSLYVYDVLGHLVMEKHKQPANQVIPINLKKAGKGVYWVKFTTSNRTVIRSILIQ